MHSICAKLREEALSPNENTSVMPSTVLPGVNKHQIATTQTCEPSVDHSVPKSMLLESCIIVELETSLS